MWSSSSAIPHYPFRSYLVTVCATIFGVQNFYILPTQCIYVFFMVLRINTNYLPMQRSLKSFINKRDGMCLLRGTN